MSNQIISNIKVLLFEDNVRLGDIVVLVNSMNKLLFNLSEFERSIVNIFLKYIANYNNVLAKKTCEEILSDFMEKIGINEILELEFYKEGEDEKVPDIFVKYETYKLFYYFFWPEFVKVIHKGIILGKEKVNFKYRIPKTFINRLYKEYENPVLKFKYEFFEMFKVNELEFIGSEEKDYYLIELEN